VVPSILSWYFLDCCGLIGDGLLVLCGVCVMDICFVIVVFVCGEVAFCVFVFVFYFFAEVRVWFREAVEALAWGISPEVVQGMLGSWVENDVFQFDVDIVEGF
jgi:hypothetical protein